MTLLTKKEIAKIWMNDNNSTELCCPHCRDNLSTYMDDYGYTILYCNNYMCLNTEVYDNKKDVEIIGEMKDMMPEWMCNKETK